MLRRENREVHVVCHIVIVPGGSPIDQAQGGTIKVNAVQAQTLDTKEDL